MKQYMTPCYSPGVSVQVPVPVPVCSQDQGRFDGTAGESVVLYLTLPARVGQGWAGQVANEGTITRSAPEAEVDVTQQDPAVQQRGSCQEQKIRNRNRNKKTMLVIRTFKNNNGIQYLTWGKCE